MPGSAAGAATGDLCAAPKDLTEGGTDFPATKAALKSGGPVDVLAMGSASMLGPGGKADRAFPARMTGLLQAAFPAAQVRLTVRSGRGLTAAGMLAALPGALAERHYSLVLWQTATVEAVRSLPADELFQTLTEGAKQVHDAGADLVLIDPQYSRFLRANADLDPYLQMMQRAAALPDVFLLRRYDLMRTWVDSGQIDLERASRTQRDSVADALHDCLARKLAESILAASSP